VEAFDLVVLAGGGGRRLGGVDKGALVVAGQSLLDRVLLAGVGARRTVVVGDRRPAVREVDWVREDPPGGGPLAALDAGLAALAAPAPDPAGIVVVLATDLPHLTSADVDRLRAALAAGRACDAAAFIDAGGRAQPLAAAYRIAPIRDALAGVGPVPGKAVKLVFNQLAVVTVPDLGAAEDCDTPDQLAAARAHFERQG
jgi:molybdopterin-guanine dinucleotide biosynthesis protein A